MRRVLKAGAIAAVLACSAVGVASAAGSNSTVAGTGPMVYQTRTAAAPSVLLPKAPTIKTLITSPPLPVGNYLVTYDIGPLLAPGDDQVGCHAVLKSLGYAGSTGISGSTGNGATESPASGLSMVTGTASVTDVFHVTKANDSVEVGCFSGNGKSLSGNMRTITALAVGTWTLHNGTS